MTSGATNLVLTLFVILCAIAALVVMVRFVLKVLNIDWKIIYLRPSRLPGWRRWGMRQWRLAALVSLLVFSLIATSFLIGKSVWWLATGDKPLVVAKIDESTVKKVVDSITQTNKSFRDDLIQAITEETIRILKPPPPPKGWWEWSILGGWLFCR